MIKKILLWNNNNYFNNIYSQLQDCKSFTDYDTFFNSVNDINQYDIILVLCELSWYNNSNVNNFCKFNGIELIKDLRIKYNLQLPVLFFSMMPLKKLINAEREIITAVGHSFSQLPLDKTIFNEGFFINLFGLEKIKNKLSILELNDIKSFYCNKEGVLSQELHSLNHLTFINISNANKKSIYNELINSLVRIHELFLSDSTSSIIKFRNQITEISQDNIKDAVRFIIEIGNNLLKLHSQSNLVNDNYSYKEEKYNWKVLLLDDQINEQHQLIKQLHSNNVEVICVNNVEEAERELILDRQKENKIMVIIADYRLYEFKNGVRYHQKIQGYQFLKNISSSDCLYRLVAFSGLERKFLLNSFKHFNIRTEVKSKTDYLSSKETIQLFCEEIIEMAEDNFEAIEALPNQSVAFKNYLSQTYKEYRMHPEYYEMEDLVSRKSQTIVRNIQKQIEKGEEIKIYPISNINSKFSRKHIDKENSFVSFQNFLIARRIALWLYMSSKNGVIKNCNSKKIAEILINKSTTLNNSKQIINTYLGLKLEDFPFNITTEERYWFQYVLQIGILDEIDQIKVVFNLLSEIYRKFIVENNEIVQYLNKSNFVIKYNYKLSIYEINFQKGFSPILKSYTDVRVLFLWISDFIKSCKINQDTIKPLVSKLRFTLLKGQEHNSNLLSLFKYFNYIYGVLNKEQSILFNISTKITDKSNFQVQDEKILNVFFERAYSLLKDSLLPNENDKADVFTLFIIGENVIQDKGQTILNDKISFFKELASFINKENAYIGISFDESRSISSDLYYD